MSNRWDIGADKTRGGWRAFYRRVHDGSPKYIMDGQNDLIFALEAEALRAAIAKHLAFINSPITSQMLNAKTPKEVASEHFRSLL